MKKIILSFVTITTILSCISQSPKTKQVSGKSSLIGNYVSDSYANRKQGYDWVSVSIFDAGNDYLKISVRSRADLKKPTCTFDGVAKKINDNTYEYQKDNQSMLFTFSKENLAISPKNETDKNFLRFYCSGGGSLENTYKKIKEELDNSQIGKTN
ncbi:hypothetical protein ACFFUE_02430 [Bergeyella porcorum]|uniref:hypothetical protein n=1 Tax=Bergeyella porcorum TaxID=1735111 RepID=UPI0035E5957A